MLQYSRWPVASNSILGHEPGYRTSGFVDDSRLMVSLAQKAPFYLHIPTRSRPDNCDGTYDSYCDPTREYTNITAIISASARTDLLDRMKIYWKDYQGDDEDFWEHEWGKHGTCISTLEPRCYSNNDSQQGVVDYFETTTHLFEELNSYSVRTAIPYHFYRLSSCSVIPNSICLLLGSSQVITRHIRPLR